MKNIIGIKNSGFKPHIIKKKNHKTDVEKTFTLREFTLEDVRGVMECVRAEHGDTYFKRFFYDEALLIETVSGDGFALFVADDGGVVAGFTMLRFYSKNGDDYIEPCSQFFLPEYRGYGLAKEMVDYVFAIAIAFEPSALFVHAAMYHNITQHTCESYGMTPVGLEVASFLTGVMKNSYRMKDIKKYSAGTLVYPVKRTDAGTVYLPEELTDYAEYIYGRIGVNVKIISDHNVETDSLAMVTGEAIDADSVTGQTGRHAILEVDDSNTLNRYVSIIVRKEGEDLFDQLDRIMDIKEDMWTFLVVLPIDTPYVFSEYDRLTGKGFFFGGLQPLCGKRESIFMYHVGDIELHMEEYVTTPAFKEICDRIDRFYEERSNG